MRKDSLSRRQLACAAAVSLLSPALRLLPGRCVAQAGQCGWLCPLVALPALLLLSLLLRRAFKYLPEGDGLGLALELSIGRWAGAGLLFAFGLWLAIYAGFLLRSGAERFISTIYPGASPWVFVGVMLLMGLPAALGRRRVLGRVAELFWPLMAIVIGAVLLFAAFNGDYKNLLPITAGDALPIAAGALPVGEVAGLILTLSALLARKGPDRAPLPGGLWCLCVCAFLTALCAVILAQFGADMTAKLSEPFFVLCRNLRLFGVVERVEALITALWVFPDFLLLGLSLRLGADCLRQALSIREAPGRPGFFDMSGGRYLTWGCAALALVSALSLGTNSRELKYISDYAVPIITASLCWGALPLGLLIGLIRKKL